MNKITCSLILCFMIGSFIIYQVKFHVKVSYIREDGIPYFKNENDILKVYDLKNKLNEGDDIAIDATIYDVISRDSGK